VNERRPETQVGTVRLSRMGLVSVAGMRLSETVLQPFMTLQAFVDESENGEVFLLGGVIASVEAWGAFSAEWEELLPLAPLGPDLKRNFKFSEMILAGLFRTEHIPIFSKVVDRYSQATLSFLVFKQDIERAKARVKVPQVHINWGNAGNPYVLAVTMMVKWFSENLETVNEWLGTDQPIEFIFDKRDEYKLLRDGWDSSVESLPEERRKRFGSDLRFEDDKRFLALQAADYVVGWIRYWLERGVEVPDVGSTFFGIPVKGRLMPHIRTGIVEDEIVKYLMDGIRRSNPNLFYVCSIKITFHGITS
jgi:hypothetical protein